LAEFNSTATHLMADTDWIKLLPVGDCPVGRARYVEISGHELAVFHLENPDRYVVVRNSCPHAGGNLAAGSVNGTQVTCPWHQWSFDLDKGACTLSPDVRLRQYESRVEQGFLFARLNGC
jgi:nitrite reductase (NADH) small subunit